MRRALRLMPALAAFLAATPDARAEPLKAFYPEGPIVAGDRVLFAEMHMDRVIAWDAEGAETFYESAGCGPTAIAPYGEGYVVLCHLTDEVHLVSEEGELTARLSEDLQGRGFVNPNDATADGKGGVYFTASGVFNRRAPAEGAVLYLDAEGIIHRLAHGLHYANGVHFDQDRGLLFVSEHLGGRIVSYRAVEPGRLGAPAVFATLAPEDVQGRDGYPLTGPDGLETDQAGNLYAAIYGAGALLVISPDGEILHRLETPEPLVTNVAISGRDLIITGSQSSSAKPFPGAVRKIANPLYPK